MVSEQGIVGLSAEDITVVLVICVALLKFAHFDMRASGLYIYIAIAVLTRQVARIRHIGETPLDHAIIYLLVPIIEELVDSLVVECDVGVHPLQGGVHLLELFLLWYGLVELSNYLRNLLLVRLEIITVPPTPRVMVVIVGRLGCNFQPLPHFRPELFLVGQVQCVKGGERRLFVKHIMLYN